MMELLNKTTKGVRDVLDNDEEINELRKEVEKLRVENETLKRLNQQ